MPITHTLYSILEAIDLPHAKMHVIVMRHRYLRDSDHFVKLILTKISPPSMNKQAIQNLLHSRKLCTISGACLFCAGPFIAAYFGAGFFSVPNVTF